MEMTQKEIDEVIACMGDEVIESIQAIEREMILDFLRSEEWKFECCEDAADAIDALIHLDFEQIH